MAGDKGKRSARDDFDGFDGFDGFTSVGRVGGRRESAPLRSRGEELGVTEGENPVDVVTTPIKTNSLWLPAPTHPAIHGQSWSMTRINPALILL